MSNEDQVYGPIEEKIALHPPNKNKSCNSSKTDFDTSNLKAELADPYDDVTAESNKTDDESLAISVQTADNQLSDSTLSIVEKPEALTSSLSNNTAKNPAKKNASTKVSFNEFFKIISNIHFYKMDFIS